MAAEDSNSRHRAAGALCTLAIKPVNSPKVCTALPDPPSKQPCRCRRRARTAYKAVSGPQACFRRTVDLEAHAHSRTWGLLQ